MVMEFDDLVEKFTEDMHFEGDSGCEELETLCSALGYEGHRFRFGSPLEEFLSDNPGAQAALVEWVSDRGVPDWRENLQKWHDCAKGADEEEPSAD